MHLQENLFQCRLDGLAQYIKLAKSFSENIAGSVQ